MQTNKINHRQTQSLHINNKIVQNVQNLSHHLNDHHEQTHMDEDTGFLQRKLDDERNIDKHNKTDEAIDIEQNNKRIYLHLPIIFLFIIILLYLSLKTRNAVQYIVETFDILQLQKHNENQQHLMQLQKSAEQTGYTFFQMPVKQKYMANNRMPDCPQVSFVFHVHLSHVYDEKSQLLTKRQQSKASRCKIPILSDQRLEQYVQKWNNIQAYQQKSIDMDQQQQDQNDQQQLTKINLSLVTNKKLLLILLQMYFNSGIYLPLQLQYPSITNRCWKYTLIGTQMMFSEYDKNKLPNGVYLPKFQTFVKSRYPYSTMVRKMINLVANNKDWSQPCRQKQCLIVQIIDIFINLFFIHSSLYYNFKKQRIYISL